MIKKFAGSIVKSFKTYDLMKYDAEVYQHGLELLLSYVIGLVIQIIFCVLMNFIWEGLFYVIFYETLYKYTGGYHANSYLACNISSFAMFLIYYLLLSYTGYSFYVMGVLIVVSVLIILKYAPLEHIHNPLTLEQINKCKKIARLLLVIYLILVVALTQYNSTFAYALSIIVFFDAVMLLVGKQFNIKG